ncbi:MAG: hypothetical protein ACI8U4_003060 [Natronomonas sp.]|jgi:hypothetical protein
MAAYRRPVLRNLFDDSPTPHIAHPPRTHRRDFYLATDGSYRPDDRGGLGVVIETRDGERVARISMPDSVPDNNVAEYRALHLGLDVLANRAPDNARVGVLIDHDDLAANVNRVMLAGRNPVPARRTPFAFPPKPPTIGGVSGPASPASRNSVRPASTAARTPLIPSPTRPTSTPTSTANPTAVSSRGTTNAGGRPTTTATRRPPALIGTAPVVWPVGNPQATNAPTFRPLDPFSTAALRVGHVVF